MDNINLKIALISPKLKIADTGNNVEEILRCYEKVAEKGCELAIFPALAVTGATCGDLFKQRQLYNSNINGIRKIAKHTKDFEATIIFGAYLEIEQDFYDCIFIASQGDIRGIIPKMLSVDHGGIDWRRWFGDGINIYEMDIDNPELGNMPIPIGDIIFETQDQRFDVIINNGSDIFYYESPDGDDECNEHSDCNCDMDEDDNLENERPKLIINVTADSTQAGVNSNRLDYYKVKSEENHCTYAYVSPGVHESSTDLVFSGQTFTVSNGVLIKQGPVFQRDSVITYFDLGKSDHIDVDEKSGRIYNEGKNDRIDNGETGDSNNINTQVHTHTHAQAHTHTHAQTHTHTHAQTPFSYEEYYTALLEDTENPLPFIPRNKDKLMEICSDSFSIQASALATRLEHTGSDKALIGISGGLDSTLALLVTVEAFNLIGKDMKDIITITMPGLGTSDQTYENAVQLMKLLGTDFREISIVDSIKQHFVNIGHDINDKNVAYENAQARERTQILMDIANDVNGLVIGTGDLSEAALGWCTYGGDHLAMYGVNESIPKTLIPYILQWISANKIYAEDRKKLTETIESIIETPISPELLPADEKGQISQKTEDTVGPYELHDYFIYHTMLNKTAPRDLLDNAEEAFTDVYDRKTIKKWLTVFYKRFFSQQFKRNCSVDCPMVTLISLSPRGGLNMPSDAAADEWINILDNA